MNQSAKSFLEKIWICNLCGHSAPWQDWRIIVGKNNLVTHAECENCKNNGPDMYPLDQNLEK